MILLCVRGRRGLQLRKQGIDPKALDQIFDRRARSAHSDGYGLGLFLVKRICTHLGCPVNLVKDMEVLAFAYNYRPPKGERHPQLGCRCHYSVFDPVRGGEAMFGKATLPLPRVRLEVRGSDVYATGIEPAPTLST